VQSDSSFYDRTVQTGDRLKSEGDFSLESEQINSPKNPLREQINDSIFYRIDQEVGAKIFR